MRITFALIVLLATAYGPAGAQKVPQARGEPVGDKGPIRILIKPRSGDSRRQELDAGLQEGSIAAVRYAVEIVREARLSIVRADYRQAEDEIRQARKHLAEHAPEAHEAFAILHAASSAVGRAEGDPEQWVQAGREVVESLEAALGHNHPAIFEARIWSSGMRFDASIATSRTYEGGINRGAALLAKPHAQAARAEAQQIMRDANEVFGPDHRISLLARLNLVSIRMAEGDLDFAGSELRLLLEKIEPNDAGLLRTALAMLGNVLAREGKTTESEALFQKAESLTGFEPALLAAGDGATLIASTRSRLRLGEADAIASGFLDAEWQSGNYADLSFCILPDGRVDNIEVLDSRGSPDWIEAARRFVRERHYSGHDSSIAGDCMPRAERIQVNSREERRTGSRIARRSRNMYIVTTDISGLEGVLPDFLIALSQR